MPATPTPGPPARPLPAVFLSAGLAATAAQVLLLRELVVDGAGDEAGIGTGLFAWLSGIALGAALTRRLRAEAAARAASRALSALFVVAPAGILAGRLLAFLLAPPAGELPGLGRSLAIALATLGPGGLLVGRAFPALALLAGPAPAVAIRRLYLFESAGSLLGGAAVTALAGFAVAPLPAALALGGGALLLAALVSGSGGLPRRPLAVATVLLALLAAASPRLDRETERLRLAGTAPGLPLRAWVDTPYQHLALAGEGPVHLYASGRYTGSFPDPWANESLAHTLSCLTPRVDRVLALGGVETGVLRHLLRHPVRELVLVEPDVRALAFLRAALPAEDRAALEDPRVRLVLDDPRRFAARPGPPFDLVLFPRADPVTLREARLVTAGSFRAAAARLAPGGVLVVPIRTAPATFAGETAPLAGSVLGALSRALPVVRVSPGPDSFLVAGLSASSATLDPEVLASRWRERAVASESFAPEVLGALFHPDRVAETEAQARRAALATPVSTDDRPVSFLHALTRRQEAAGSAAGRWLARLGALPAPVLAGLAILPALAGLARTLRQRATLPAAASHAVGAGGGSAMGLSLLLLLSYQTADGALYGRLGLLTALFMAGLSLGALATRRLGDEASIPRARRHLVAALALAAALGFGTALCLPRLAAASGAGALAALSLHGVLLLATGAATGALFPLGAAVLSTEGTGRAAARLQTADHAGAAVAALAVPVVLVPALGLGATAALLAALLALASARVAVAR
ncbi:MAG: hypothetical protein EDX89_20645 [Acidobacteria bacterium]|nr:MAG: hypothetical protein EDX89_20645 [Acidobacteriota bacterium]